MDNQAQGQSLQRVIDILGDWVLQWQIKFNTDKCKVIHYGRKSRFQCNLYGQSVVDVDSVQKRTWVWCSPVTSKSVFSVVKRTTEPVSLLVSFTIIKHKNQSVLVSLYKSMVHPHLEYCSAAWSPHHVKHKVLLERVQHRFTRMFSDLKKLPYKERLSRLGLWSLKE